MPTGIKHVVKCRCVMTQFKRATNPPIHQFTVFSIIDDDDNVQQKFAQCNNCGVIHKIVDVCKSEIIQQKEHMNSLMSISDLQTSMPTRLSEILETNKCDIATWEFAQFILENKQWDRFVVLSSDIEDNLRQGKILRILGENLFKIDSFTREEVIK